MAQTTTDTSGILKSIELELVRLQWTVADKGLMVTVQLTEEQIGDILSECNGSPKNSSWEPGKDSIYTQ